MLRKSTEGDARRMNKARHSESRLTGNSSTDLAAATRIFSRDGTIDIVRKGGKVLRRGDLYHWFLSLRLWSLVGLCAGAYLLMNSFFALLYLLDSEGVANARPGNFADAFFFSVQTMATIGYGSMYPKSVFANLVVTVETVVGLLSFALITGLLFSRFSRPTARVLFSNVATVAPYNGVPTLMFRVANERRNQILQAEISVTLLRTEHTAEGVEVRRQLDLKLVRARSAFFSLSWTIMHPIDESSPLWGQTPESLAAAEVELAILLTGTDETFNQMVHGRFAYSAAEILWNRRLADIVHRMPDGQRIVDYTRFHDTLPL
jgi:inward rectifier potassium channel